MAQLNHFIVENDDSGTLLICVEPEGAIVSIASGEKVQVSEQFDKHPVTLRVSLSEEGFPMIDIWPGDGRMLVEKNGVDVLDL